MHDLLTDLIEAIGHALVHSTWQCALVGTLAAFLLRMADGGDHVGQQVMHGGRPRSACLR